MGGPSPFSILGAYSKGTQPPLLYCSVMFWCFMRFRSHYFWHNVASFGEGDHVLAMCLILLSGLFDVVLAFFRLRTLCLGRAILELRCRKLLSGRNNGGTTSIFHHFGVPGGGHDFPRCTVTVMLGCFLRLGGRFQRVGASLEEEKSCRCWHPDTVELFVHVFSSGKRVILPSGPSLQWNMKLSKSSSIALLRWR
jgi:hypothetical protein